MLGIQRRWDRLKSHAADYTGSGDNNSENCSTCSAVTARRHGLHSKVCISGMPLNVGTVLKKCITAPQLGHAARRSVSMWSISSSSRPDDTNTIVSDSLRRSLVRGAAATNHVWYRKKGIRMNGTEGKREQLSVPMKPELVQIERPVSKELRGRS